MVTIDPPVGRHERHDAADEVGDAREVLVDERPLALLRHVEEPGPEPAAGVVDQHVDPAEPLADRREEPGDRLGVADVEPGRDDLPAQTLELVDERVEVLDVAVAHREIRAEPGEGEGGGPPDADRRPGHDGHPAGRARRTPGRGSRRGR